MSHDIESQLDYTFKQMSLLTLALKHRSYANQNNERLEFLGDAILGSVIACYLFDRFQASCEGGLSRLRAQLVKKETLAQLAERIDLGQSILLGEGELKSGGFRRASILADGLEAVFGAIYLDGGFDEARRVILSLYEPLLSELSIDAAEKDPKTRLQEYLQSKQMPLPVYEITQIKGEAHDQTFEVVCTIEGQAHQTEGSGTSRRRAEQIAAQAWLDRLEVQ